MSGDNQSARISAPGAQTFVVSFMDPWWDRSAKVPGYKPGASPVMERRWTWAQLGRYMTTFQPTPPVNSEGVADKTALRGWCPVAFANNRRNAANALSISCLVLDYDGGAPLSEALATWADWPLIWHTSWSHGPERAKFRIILPLAKPAEPKTWLRIWEWADRRTLHRIDEKCKDPCRLYFVPAMRSADAPMSAGVVDPGGELLDLDPATLPLTKDERAAAERQRLRATRKPVTYANADSYRAARRRALIFDADERYAFAKSHGAQFRGMADAECATHLKCPGCGRLEVWFYVERGDARCNHQNSCGWRGPLIELEEG